jgi:hypothetical protein
MLPPNQSFSFNMFLFFFTADRYILDSFNFTIIFQKFLTLNHICIAMVSVFLLNVVDREFESRSDQTKDDTISICCFWCFRNQDNVSEWSDISTRGQLFLWTITMNSPTKCVGLVQHGPHPHLNTTCFLYNMIYLNILI